MIVLAFEFSLWVERSRKRGEWGYVVLYFTFAFHRKKTHGKFSKAIPSRANPIQIHCLWLPKAQGWYVPMWHRCQALPCVRGRLVCSAVRGPTNSTPQTQCWILSHHWELLFVPCLWLAMQDGFTCLSDALSVLAFAKWWHNWDVNCIRLLFWSRTIYGNIAWWQDPCKYMQQTCILSEEGNFYCLTHLLFWGALWTKTASGHTQTSRFCKGLAQNQGLLGLQIALVRLTSEGSKMSALWLTKY